MSGLGAAIGRILIDTADLQRAQKEVQSASQAMTRALGSLGVGVGSQQFARFALEANELATAFGRQSVAARELAGSQGRVNDLLRVYDRATGGIIGKAQALSDVTRLMAVGFADSTAELDQFVRAVRGISLATGRPQEFIITNLQLELLNQTGFRLDQIGLGMEEVRKRADELRAANSTLTQEQAYQAAVLETANRKFGALTQAAEAQATAVERLRKAWTDFQLEFGQNTGGALNAFAEGGIRELEGLQNNVEGLTEDLRRLKRAVNELNEGGRPTTGLAGFLSDAMDNWLRGNHIGDFITELNRLLGLGVQGPQFRDPVPSWMTSSNTPLASAAGGAVFTPEQRQVIRDHYDAIAELEEQAARDRQDATRQYEEQRTSTIRQYELSIAREAEDFARGRLRAEQDFQRSVERIQRDAHRRDERAAQDLARSLTRFHEDSTERIADLQEDANKRIADLDEDFKKDQERREEDFQDDLLEAAGRLDAIRILELRKDRARQLKDAKDAHDEQRSDLQEQLDERINDEKEAHEERRQDAQEAFARQLADAREADRQRQEDMQADFDLRQTREDKDRETRLRRMGEDFRLQLDELARQHALRIQQIGEQQARERTKLGEEFNKALNEAGIRNDAWIKENNRVTDAAVADYTRATQAAAANAAWLAQIAAGGGVNFPSLANPNLNLVRPIPGPSNNTPTGGWGREITINIYGDGLNERQVVELMVDKLEEMAGGGGGRTFAP